MASDLAVWAAFGVTVVVLASAIMFFVKRGVGVSRAVACASVGPDGCKVTYRDVFGGGEGFYLVQVQPVSGDAESQ